MSISPARVVAGGAALAGTVAFAQLLPAVSCLRRVRNLAMPGLAGVGDPGHVALTFDDGPDPASTPAFLDTLDALGWRATFFMLGTMASAAPELVIEVAQRGHEVAVHGSKHSNHLRRGPRWSTRDILSASDLLAELSGSRPRWYRPPYGALATSTLIAVRRVGLRPILWTTWGRDWREGSTPESVVEEVEGTMARGATVLLHDSDCTSAPGAWKATIAALPLLAEIWAAQGLTIGPLSEHLTGIQARHNGSSAS